jgi:catechol 2,3-dioxygenase-like lactoylglutathione lyase family enzyme
MSVVKPILRIFDRDKAIEFYVNWLGFTIDWEHGEADSPVYLQLPKHHGDCTPGARIFIDDYTALDSYHAKLIEKNYKYNRPALDIPFYDENALEMTAIDPFGNRLTFVERRK